MLPLTTKQFAYISTRNIGHDQCRVRSLLKKGLLRTGMPVEPLVLADAPLRRVEGSLPGYDFGVWVVGALPPWPVWRQHQGQARAVKGHVSADTVLLIRPIGLYHPCKDALTIDFVPCLHTSIHVYLRTRSRQLHSEAARRYLAQQESS